MSRDRKKAQRDKKRKEAILRARLAESKKAKERASAERAHEFFERARREHLAGDLVAAEAVYRKVLDLVPTHAGALTNLATVANRHGRLDEALALGRRAVEREPGMAETHLNLGGIYLSRGELDDAARHFERACELRPGYGDAHVVRTTLRRYESADDPHVREMEALVAKASAIDKTVAPLHFGLAKAYEDIGDYDRAFGHLAQGNRLHRARIQYDLGFFADLMERIANLHGPEFIARGADPSCAAEAPILVVGMPRSGTTLVEQILTSHSQVCAVGETGDLEAVVRSLCERADEADFPEQVAAAEPATLAALGRTYAQSLARRAPGAERIVDKGLSNFLHIGFLRRALPEARIVHCRRDPADTCLSCFKTLFSSALNYTYDLTELGGRFQLYRGLMDHWQTVVPDIVLDVAYEDVVADLEGQTRRLLDHCGLEWEEACLEFHRTERAVHTASVTQVRKPIYTTAVARWKRYEKHLGPLFEALGPYAPDG